jgi:hypothetical protein
LSAMRLRAPKVSRTGRLTPSGVVNVIRGEGDIHD